MTGETASNGSDIRQESIRDVLQRFSDEYLAEDEGATVLAYTPKACRFLRLKGVTAEDDDFDHGPDGPNGFSLDDVFELRAFTPDAELRWLKHEAGGRAVILTDETLAQSGFTCLGGAAYVLWGPLASGCLTERESDDVWFEVEEARIGRLWIPVLNSKKRELIRKLSADGPTPRRWLRLIAQEYMTVGRHGNVTVAEERLLRIEAYDGEGPRS